MTPKEIAKIILDVRENRMSSFIMPGELREKLGFEGYGEAMRLRWLVADSESSGMVQVTSNLSLLEEIRKIAECEPCAKSPGEVTYGEPKLGSNPVEYPSGSSTEQKMGNEAPKSDDEGGPVKKSWSNESARFALAHAHRHFPIQEIAPPATGKPAVAMTPSVPATTPVTTAAATGHLPPDANIGDEVIVASEGQTYTAKVARKSPDGTYSLSFGNKGPRDGTRPYKPSEFKVTGVAAPAK